LPFPFDSIAEFFSPSKFGEKKKKKESKEGRTEAREIDFDFIRGCGRSVGKRYKRQNKTVSFFWNVLEQQQPSRRRMRSPPQPN
jgi:hypothetical protein